MSRYSYQCHVDLSAQCNSLRMLRLSFSKVPAFQLNNFQVDTQYNSTRFFSLDYSIVSYTQSPVFKDNVGVIPLITFNLAKKLKVLLLKHKISYLDRSEVMAADKDGLGVPTTNSESLD